MIVVHIANIDTSVIGGVQAAVPKMVKAQSSYAEVCLINTHGDLTEGVRSLQYDEKFDVDKLPEPFNRPSLVVFHEVYRFEYISIYKNLIKRGIPYIIIPHGCLSKQAQRKKYVKKLVANIVFFNKFLRNARSIQYLSNNEQAMSAFAKYPSVVMGNGVSVPSRKKDVFSTSDIRFVYIGRLEIHIKGLDMLLEAIQDSVDILRQNGAVFEIYGPDYDNSHELLSQMIRKLQIEDLVRVEKEITGVEKQEVLLSATCFIQPSRTEGLPLGPLEALSYGLPCIVTRSVGLGKTIESYGAGYQAEATVEGISGAVKLFLENVDKSEEMSRSATRMIKENFDIDVIAEETVNMYHSTFN